MRAKRVKDYLKPKSINQIKNDINGLSKEQLSKLLLVVAREGNTIIVQYLIDIGVDVNTKNNAGWSPLMSGVRHNNKDIVKILLDNGANTDTETISGNTPLILASRYSNKDMIELLKKYGAKI